jgi:hypothetical protein
MPNISRTLDTDLKPNDLCFIPYSPGAESAIEFEAHIGTVTTSSSPSWSSAQDMGRADAKQMYSSISHTVGISFKVISTNSDESSSNRAKLVKLGLCTYPTYSETLGFNGKHIFFKIGDLISGFGIITNLGYTWNDDVPWIDRRPIITDVSLDITLLADSVGQRPNAESSKFL